MSLAENTIQNSETFKSNGISKSWQNWTKKMYNLFEYDMIHYYNTRDFACIDQESKDLVLKNVSNTLFSYKST